MDVKVVFNIPEEGRFKTIEKRMPLEFVPKENELLRLTDGGKTIFFGPVLKVTRCLHDYVYLEFEITL